MTEIELKVNCNHSFHDYFINIGEILTLYYNDFGDEVDIMFHRDQSLKRTSMSYINEFLNKGIMTVI